MNAIQAFDYLLGGGKLYRYNIIHKNKAVVRYRSNFDKIINHKLYLKSK